MAKHADLKSTQVEYLRCLRHSVNSSIGRSRLCTHYQSVQEAIKRTKETLQEYQSTNGVTEDDLASIPKLPPLGAGVGLWEICYDWAQPFGSCQYSVGIISLRCTSLNEEDKCKSFNNKLLAIIPGPKQPDNFEIYLDRTLRVFEVAGLNGAGLTTMRGHFPFLMGIAADTPARCKLSHETGVGSYRGCGTCLFTGERVGNTTCYRGYAAPVQQVDSSLRQVGDSQLQFDDAKGRSLAEKGEAQPREENGKTTGYHALSRVHKMLPYTSFKSLWLTPVCHALLHGLVRDFFKFIFERLPKLLDGTGGNKPAEALATGSLLAKITSDQHKELLSKIKSAKSQITVSSEFNRRYKCAAQYWKSYTMEDELNFVECYSAFVFRDGVLPTPLAEAPMPTNDRKRGGYEGYSSRGRAWQGSYFATCTTYGAVRVSSMHVHIQPAFCCMPPCSARSCEGVYC